MPSNGLILTAHQPVYLPWCGLIHKIALADAFVFFDDVQYQDRDWNNRNMIKTSAEPLWLTVPVFNKDHFDLKVKDVKICADQPWGKKHWRSISISYAKAPFAKRYLPWFEDLYKRPWDKLADLNEYILRYVLAELQIKVAFSKLSEMGLESKKSALVQEMCEKMGAKLYIFGEQGKNYADVSAFNAAGIQLEFQEYKHPVYKQLYGDFVSHLTVFDLLMNHGPDESLAILMSGNISREDLIKKHFVEAAV
jgi:hypothetical protein